MGQITHPTLGSPMALVTPYGQLVVAGSMDISSTSGNSLAVYQPGVISTLNSTTTPLIANGSFVGDWEDVKDYSIIYVSVRTDVNSQDSGNYGFNLEFSQDATVKDVYEEYYIASGTSGKIYSVQPSCRYFRVNYINGATQQGLFRLQTQFRDNYGKPSSHRIDEPINDQNDAELSKSVITGKRADGVYGNVSLTNGDNIKASIEELETGISTNSNSQLNTSPYIMDEYTNYNHVLGDNVFKGAVISIPPEHHEIHCGDSYELSFIETLGNGESQTMLIVVPNEGLTSGTDPAFDQSKKMYHIKGYISTQAEAMIEFFEGPTVTNSGAAIPIFNRNRNSYNEDFLGAFYGTTVSNSGTRLQVDLIGAGKTAGGNVSREDEWILKDNTAYLLKITNETTSNNNVDAHINYYVHPGV